MEGMDFSPEFDAYSGVEIIIDEETSIFSGNRSGRVLSFSNPFGTKEQADNILASLKSTGFQYQPFTASGALLNPAAEIGDGVTINGLYSGIYKISRSYDAMSPSDIEAPQDEELDHEYPYEPKEERIFRREIADAQAQITLNQNAITAEVTRATTAEGSLSSRITQNATSINAKVSQTGGDNSSFGWSLLSNKFSLFAGNKEVFKCTSGGVEIQGKITATSGAIGGFTIGSSAIYKGMTTLNSTSNGVYVGTNGIAVGGGAFKAASDGTITAKGIKLQGTLTFLNADGTSAGTLSAANLRSGAKSAYDNGSYWGGGGAAGTKFSNMASGSGSYPINASTFRINGRQYLPQTFSFVDGNGNTYTIADVLTKVNY